MIKENGKVFEVTEGFTKRIKISGVAVTGGGSYECVDWIKSPIKFEHSKQLVDPVTKEPVDGSAMQKADGMVVTNFIELIAMAGGDIETLVGNWADKMVSESVVVG